jgi:rubredoxin
MEKIINNEGDLNLQTDYAYKVENLYEYWDIVRKDFQLEVRDLLDPHKITNLMRVDMEQLTRVLYMLSSLYSSKGTETMFRLILRLAGMDANLIRWYQDEYLDWRPRVEKCNSVMVIRVGDNPITEDMVDHFNELLELLLDVCLVISFWIYVKNLTDDAEIFDTVAQVTVNMGHYDKYSVCGFELYERYGYDTYYSWEDPYDYAIYRDLTTRELTRYKCNSCEYIYDPLEHDRTPFSEVSSSWVCPICGVNKYQFESIELEPSYALEALKWILGSMCRNDLFINVINLASTFDGSTWGSDYDRLRDFLDTTKQIVSTSYIDDILNHPYGDDVVCKLLYLLRSIQNDKYESLTEVGITVNPAAIDLYYRGKIGSPYLLHGHAHSRLYCIYHYEDPTCPHYHNQRWTHCGPSGVAGRDEYQGEESFQVHVKDPTLRYVEETSSCFLHNNDYVRGQRFDLERDPRIRCDVEKSCYVGGGAYAYPRHLGPTVDEPDDFFLGYSNSVFDPQLTPTALFLEGDGNTPSLISYLRGVANTIGLSFSTPDFRNFAEAMGEFSQFVYDQNYLLNLKDYASTKLSPFQLSQLDGVIDYISYIRDI